MGSVLISSKTRRIFYFFIASLTLFHFFGLFGDLMEADAALYASIAKTIAITNEWRSLYVNNVDWLDKPHLTFWFAALSFKIFGISPFAYKLPSFLISLVGYWYLFKLTRAIYNEKVGLIAVIICMSALHQLISNYDVRAEGYLSAFAIAGIYHFYRASNSSFKHIVLGSFFSALAVMIKGIFVLIPIFGGFIVYWALTRQFAEFVKLKWYMAVLLVFVFILPELWALYVQFDLHPEKVVFDQANVSGVKFFFWDSQFGRFFNNGPIKGRGEITFFIHTTLWAFLPWCIPFVAALVQLAKKQVRRAHPSSIIIVWGSAVVTFLIFSLSKFQLPHYIIIIFPQFSIITAHYISTLNEQQERVFGKISALLGVAIVLLLTVVIYFLKLENSMVFYIVAALLIAVLFFSQTGQKYLLIRNVMITAFALVVFLYAFFYPSILKYQAGMQAAKWLNKNHPHLKPVSLDHHAFAFDFYHKDIVKHVDLTGIPKMNGKANYVFFVKDDMLEAFQSKFPADVLGRFEYFRITKLKPKFINAKTRKEVLTHFYLVKIH